MTVHRVLYRVFLDDPTQEVGEFHFEQDPDHPNCGRWDCKEDDDFSLILPENGRKESVSLYEGGHWERGDRDESFPIDRIDCNACDSDQIWLSSREVAEFIRGAAQIAFQYGKDAMQKQVAERLFH